jgi:hypothetical protein
VYDGRGSFYVCGLEQSMIGWIALDCNRTRIRSLYLVFGWKREAEEK